MIMWTESYFICAADFVYSLFVPLSLSLSCSFILSLSLSLFHSLSLCLSPYLVLSLSLSFSPTCVLLFFDVIFSLYFLAHYISDQAREGLGTSAGKIPTELHIQHDPSQRTNHSRQPTHGENLKCLSLALSIYLSGYSSVTWTMMETRTQTG